MSQLEIRDLWASIDGETILKGVNLVVPKGGPRPYGPQRGREEHPGQDPGRGP